MTFNQCLIHVPNSKYGSPGKTEADQKSSSISSDNCVKSTVEEEDPESIQTKFSMKQHYWIYVHSRYYNITTYHGQDSEDWEC